MLNTKYIGMDIHTETISIAVRNAAGKIVMECVSSEGRSYIRVLPHTKRGARSILGSCVSILGWFGLHFCCCIVALGLWWRASARGFLACMVPWWLSAFVIFALPSLYLDGQGNASIFI
jgi:hypothetical protein